MELKKGSKNGNSIDTNHDIEKGQKRLSSDKLSIYGFDVSNFSRNIQFLLCASTMLLFSLLYGYFQELVSVNMLNRQLTFFLSAVQLGLFSFWSLFLCVMNNGRSRQSGASLKKTSFSLNIAVPLITFLGLSCLKSLDLELSNRSMQYLNYPAKTLLRSSRVFFVMISGIVIGRKRYSVQDFILVICLLLGLLIFLHADLKSVSTVFHPIGVCLMISALFVDGIFNNWAEIIMNKYSLCHDHFNLYLYFIAFSIAFVMADINGEIKDGISFLSKPGTIDEIANGTFDESSWSVHHKMIILLLFSVTGLFGASSAAAITKNFGALTTSLVSTTRKAMTLFLSFIIFHHDCTPEHVVGIIIFFTSLVMKSIRASVREK